MMRTEKGRLDARLPVGKAEGTGGETENRKMGGEKREGSTPGR